MDNQNQPSTPQVNPVTPPPAVPSTEPKPYNKRNWKKWAAIYTVIAIVIYGGLYYFYLGKQNPYSSNYSSPTTAKTPTSVPTVDPTADWKTYNNSKYNYTVQYPDDWSVVDVHTDEIVTFGGKGQVGEKPPLVSIHVFETSKFKEADIPNYSPFDYKIKINGNYTFFFVASSYQIGGTAPKETEQQAKEALLQILSTFKFTDQTTVDTSSWKTYTASKFSFRYPANLVIKETDKDFFVFVESTTTPASNSNMSIDSRLSGNYANYDTAVTSTKDGLINIKEETMGSWLKINGTMKPGFREGTPLSVALYKYNQGAIEFEIAGSAPVSEQIFNQILSTFKFTQ